VSRRSLVVVVSALLSACTAFRGSTKPRVYGSPVAALDCAAASLEAVGFQVQGREVGAPSMERLTPGRRAMDLLARNESRATGTLAYVRVLVGIADSTPAYNLRTFGFSTSLDGTERSAVQHDQGVEAVVSQCGAIRTTAAMERPR
jgi:hypothetical protein